jgi:hypothetical protein
MAHRLFRAIHARDKRWSLRRSSAQNFIAYGCTVCLSLTVYRSIALLTGVPVLGVWALAQGFSGISRSADLGAGTNLTRFLAGHAPGTRRTLLSTIRLAAIVCFLPVAALSCVIGYFSYSFVTSRAGTAVSPANVAELVVYALLCAFLGTLNSTFVSLAEGYGRTSLGSVTVALYNAVALLLLVPLVHVFGVGGVGLANLVGMLAQTAALATALYRIFVSMPASSDSDMSSLEIFRDLRGELFSNAGTVLARLALEPVTRLLVAASADLGHVAIFELCLRIASQARALIQAALQPLLFLGARNKSRAALEYVSPHRLLTAAAGAVLLSLNCLSPFMSFFFFGRILPDFLLTSLILSAGMFANIMGVTGYFYRASVGDFAGLLRATLVMVFINSAGGIALFLAFGSNGAVAAYSIAFAVCGYIQLRPWWRSAGEPPASTLRVLALSAAGSAVIFATYQLIVHAGVASDMAIAFSSGLAAVISLASLGWLAVRRYRSQEAFL